MRDRFRLKWYAERPTALFLERKRWWLPLWTHVPQERQSLGYACAPIDNLGYLERWACERFGITPDEIERSAAISEQRG